MRQRTPEGEARRLASMRTPEYREKKRQEMLCRENPGKNKSDETKQKIGLAAKGRICSEETRQKRREAMRDKPGFFKGKKHKSESIEKIKEKISGKNHYNWKNGISSMKAYTTYVHRRKIGFTEEIFNARFKEQGGNCAICLKNLEDKTIKMAADHCHKTMKARGILCRLCNSILGFAYDNAEVLQRGAEYLRYWQRTA